jgi:hypothetical protein
MLASNRPYSSPIELHHLLQLYVFYSCKLYYPIPLPNSRTQRNKWWSRKLGIEHQWASFPSSHSAQILPRSSESVLHYKCKHTKHKEQKNSQKVLSFSAAHLLILSNDHTSPKSAAEESLPSLPLPRNIKDTEQGNSSSAVLTLRARTQTTDNLKPLTC